MASDIEVWDDEAVAAAISTANIPALIMSVIHMTGDTSLLDGPVRPERLKLNDLAGRMAPEDEAIVHARAMEAFRAWRERGFTPAPPPSRETLRRMMDFCVGSAVPEEYVDLLIEELAIDGVDRRSVGWSEETARERAKFKVLVIGAGMSGVLAAIKLKEAGFDYAVVERNPAIGGTWWENRYPGCRVDVPAHFYSYSFSPLDSWTSYFPERAQISDYLDRCAREHGVRERIRFETEVVSAVYCEADGMWDVTLRSAAGTETLRVNAVISAVGQFNQPKLPDIPGRERFAGPAFHSARWPDGLELAGKRVAVVGSGASAFQLVPELARTASQLTVFQRTPGWMMPNASYYDQVDEATRWRIRTLPGYARWRRFMLWWASSDGALPFLQIDPAWPHMDRSISSANEALRRRFTDYIRDQIGDDEALLEKVLPTYPPFGKRPLIDNGAWLKALREPNVELVTQAVTGITETGVIDATGAEHEVDAIVFCTGFEVGRFLYPLQITGRGGKDLRAWWQDEPRAYLGITVPDFPNFFCLYGPSTNLGHGGSIIFISECQVRYVTGCLKAVVEGGARAIECRPEVHAAYHEKLSAALAGMVWSHPEVRTYYKNAAGKVTTTSPWRIIDYWRWTRAPDLADFALS